MTYASSTSLLRSLLREAGKMNDYNFRSYALRRVKGGFQKNQSLQGSEAAAAIQVGQEQLEVLKRQAIIGNLYPSETNVMETGN